MIKEYVSFVKEVVHVVTNESFDLINACLLYYYFLEYLFSHVLISIDEINETKITFFHIYFFIYLVFLTDSSRFIIGNSFSDDKYNLRAKKTGKGDHRDIEKKTNKKSSFFIRFFSFIWMM